MGEISFEVDNHALQVIQSTELTANFAEVKEALVEMLAPYKAQVVLPETISAAKADKAKINKTIKAIDTFRKTVKAAASAPITAFEDKCKELTALCKEAVNGIDEQVKYYDEKEAQEKLKTLREYYDNKEIKHPEYISFEQVQIPEWKNKTYKLDKAKFDIDAAIRQNDLDVDTILAINKSYLPALLDRYMETHDIYAVLSLNERYADMERINEQRKMEAENFEKTQKEIDAFAETFTLPEEPKVPVQPAAPTPAPAPAEDDVLYNIQFSVTATEKQLDALQAYMENMGIRWRVV